MRLFESPPATPRGALSFGWGDAAAPAEVLESDPPAARRRRGPFLLPRAPAEGDAHPMLAEASEGSCFQAFAPYGVLCVSRRLGPAALLEALGEGPEVSLAGVAGVLDAGPGAAEDLDSACEAGGGGGGFASAAEGVLGAGPEGGSAAVLEPDPERRAAGEALRLLAACLPGRGLARAVAQLLVEGRVVLTSDCTGAVAGAVAALRSCLRPLAWQHVYAPVVPRCVALQLLDCPVPFLLGMPSALLDPSDPHALSLPPSVLRVDLDAGEVAGGEASGPCEAATGRLARRLAALRRAGAAPEAHAAALESFVRDVLGGAAAATLRLRAAGGGGGGLAVVDEEQFLRAKALQERHRAAREAIGAAGGVAVATGALSDALFGVKGAEEPLYRHDEDFCRLVLRSQAFSEWVQQDGERAAAGADAIRIDVPDEHDLPPAVLATIATARERDERRRRALRGKGEKNT